MDIDTDSGGAYIRCYNMAFDDRKVAVCDTVLLGGVELDGQQVGGESHDTA